MADADNARRTEPGTRSAVEESDVAVADTARSREEPSPEVHRDVAGYAPMVPAAAEDQPAGTARTPAAARAAKPAPVRGTARDPAEDPPVDRRKLEATLRDGVEECYRVVRSKELDQLARLYDPKTASDEDKLRRLTRILRTEPWQATVGRRVDGVRELGPRAAAAEFSFRLAWRDSYGGRLSSQPIFRAEFTRDGEEWTMSSCRIVGSPKL